MQKVIQSMQEQTKYLRANDSHLNREMKARKRAKEKQEAIKAKQAEDLKKLGGMSPFS